MARPGRAGALLATLVSIVVVVALPLALILNALSDTFFDPQRVAPALSEHLIQSGDLRALVAQELLRVRLAPNDEGLDSLDAWLSHLNSEDRSAISSILFPDSWVTDQLTTNLAEFYAWLESGRSEPDLRLDLRPVKQRLFTGGDLQVAEIVVASWPICSDAELERLTAAASGTGDHQAIACQPPSPLRAMLVETLVEGLRTEVIQTPDQINLSNLFEDDETGTDSTQLRLRLNQLKSLAASAWMLPAAGFGLILALGVRSWRALLLRWGSPILGSGLLGVLLALIAIAALPSWAADIGRSGGPNPLVQPLSAALETLLRGAVGRYFVGMILLGLLGTAMTAAGWAVQKRNEPAPQNASVPPEEEPQAPSGMFG